MGGFLHYVFFWDIVVSGGVIQMWHCDRCNFTHPFCNMSRCVGSHAGLSSVAQWTVQPNIIWKLQS